MSKMLNISRSLSLPLGAITDTFAFLARKGAGKTYSAMVLAEEMLTVGAQIVVLDPVSKWWGLRLGTDGKSRGLDIPIFGGPHGDIPLSPKSGALVAQTIVEQGISVVLDLSGFDSDAEQRRFVTDFAKKLYRLKQKERDPSPLHLFLEEAEEFLPQDQMRDQAHMIGAIKKIIKLGRNYGIGCTLVTQRSADVNKKGLSQVGTLFALQTTSPHDRKAIKEWAHGLGMADGLDANVSKVLPTLSVGQALVWSPGDGVVKKIKFRKKKTLDTSATPKMKKRKKKMEVRSLDRGQLDALAAAMGEIVDEQKRNDPRALRKRINELERELKKGAAASKEIRVEVPVTVVTPQEIEAIKDYVAAAQQACKAISEITASADQAIKRVQKGTMPFSQRPPRPPRPPVPKAPSRRNGDIKIKKGARKMLAVLAAKSPLTKQQLGTLAGFKITGGTFGDYLGTLRRSGLLVKSGGSFDITDEGRAFIGDEALDVPSTTEELVQFWSTKVKAGARKMLRTLVDVYPEGLSKAELAETLDYAMSGGTFNDYIGTLRRNGLVTSDDGVLHASENLFP